MKTTLQGKRVTVMGLGLHGGALGTIEWLLKQGAIVTATDLKTEDQLRSTVEKLQGQENLRFVLGQHNAEDFSSADLIIRNPAVPRTSEYLTIARENNIPIEMDSSLFFEHSASTDIIGITGSKGKTSASTAISTVLKAHNPNTVAVGIDGVSPLRELERVSPETPVVFELSSWRLEALDEKKMSPKTAVVTSIYRDHLNTYNSFEEYIETKKVIFRYQSPEDIVILNYDDPVIRTWESEVPSHAYWYSLSLLPDSHEGIFVDNGMIYVRQNGSTHELFAVDSLPLKRAHEQQNLLPSLLIGFLRGMTVDNVQKAVATVQPLPHRLEIVRELDGVTYINDSAATMPDATIAALTSLTEKPIVHILGGSDKALVFDELAQVEAQSTVKALVWLPGTATDAMKEALTKHVSVPMHDAKDMNEAVHLAKELAESGDIVLLSPGATSFGLFQHEFDRGNKYKKAVLEI